MIIQQEPDSSHPAHSSAKPCGTSSLLARKRAQGGFSTHPFWFINRRTLGSATTDGSTPSQDRAPPYDLIVVGYGLAGACAALSAAEKGLRVLILDSSHGGGASKLSGGVVYAGGGTRYQRAAGFNDTPENMFNYLKLEVGDAVSDASLKNFCDGSVEGLEWLESHGAKFDSSFAPYKTSYPTDKHYLYFSGNEKAWPYNEHAKPVPRGHRMHEKGLDAGRALWAALAESVKKHDIEFQPLSRVQKLIQDEETGRIRGVEYNRIPTTHPEFARHKGLVDSWNKVRLFAPKRAARLNDQAERLFASSAVPNTATANAGVVLSAGGFAFNKSMRNKYLPAYKAVGPLGTPADDGSGIALGASVGGVTSHMNKMSAWRFLSPPSAFLKGVAVSRPVGKRIVAEDLYGATFTETFIHKHGGEGYLILDSNMWAQAKGEYKDQVDWPMRFQVLTMLYWAHWKASSIPDLAAKLDVDPTALSNTVEAYNTGISPQGTGDAMHKTPEYSEPLSTPPFYAIDISVRDSGVFQVPGITLGGLKVDGETGMVLRGDGSKLQGLWAAGRTAVGICGNGYVSGLSLADCTFSGRRAGENAAQWLGRR
jgi:3-oxo-5alpha-steroid 4-dehydrogenase